MTNLLCRLGIHAKVRAAEPTLFRNDLHRCRHCPAQWRIGSHGYFWGTVRYRERIADAAGPYDHATAQEAEKARAELWRRWRPRG